MILNPNPLKYTVHTYDNGLTWTIQPPINDPHIHRGPFPRWKDAIDAAHTHTLVNARPGAVTEESFHVDTD